MKDGLDLSYQCCLITSVFMSEFTEQILLGNLFLSHVYSVRRVS